MKRYKVYWTREATIDLGEIVDYIAKDRVIFKLTDSTVYIFAVIDGRRDVESILFERLLRINVSKK